jgi:DNA ligase (NAD+)
MNIDGLSEKSLEVFIDKGYLKDFMDIYTLDAHRNKLIHLDGFGPKSVDKLLAAIDKSREVKLEHFITALGIDGIGLSAAKTISKYCDGYWDRFLDLCDDHFDWTTLEDFGEITANNLNRYYDLHQNDMYWLGNEMNFIIPESIEIKENPFTNKSICVTGKLHSFTRNSINEKIVSLGAKAVGSVSSKTDYLITNEQSGSSKYKKAVELNIPIITEDEFLEMLGE